MAATTIEWSSFHHSTITVSVSVREALLHLRSGYYAGFVGNVTATLCPE